MPASHRFFVTAPRGLEPMLAVELPSLGVGTVREQRGGVSVSGSLDFGYRICLWSRIANRVLLPVAEFQAADPDALHAGVQTIPWLEHMDAATTMAVVFTGIRAAIGHSRYAAQRIKDAVVDQIRDATGTRPSVDTESPDLRINVHMHGNLVTVAIDLSGDSLHRRGYRRPGIPAPLKENLAAAVLLRGDWPAIAARGGGFVDPMCGSGTLAIEAAWIASDTAPALLRTRFGFLGWRGHRDALWKSLLDEALERQERGLARMPPVIAYDQDAGAVRQALDNVRRAGLSGRVHVERRELADAEPPPHRPTGLVAVNPPYGQRLDQDRELVSLYARLGEMLRQRFDGWTAIVLTGADTELGLRPERSWVVYNGPIRCRLERFVLETRQKAAPPPARAESLNNRIARNRRQLSRWLQQEGISNYRIYDADIPEYALAVDVYGTEQGEWMHVQEYEPPATVNPRDARARLRAALATLPEALGIPSERLVLKVRRRQRGGSQYTRQAAEGRFLEVREGRCRLLVNLTDYLDTGLFLDHRPVRHWLGDNARDRRFLNLFCYTGAATVHAALGGARSTTSVDLSRTYLDWLNRNLRLNSLADPAHRLVHADCRQWLGRCDEQFDLIFLDPPSFSRSARMEGTLDIQRDHVELLQQVIARLAPGGVLVFSTNLRRFRLDNSRLSGVHIEDRTAWSIPRDFSRSPRIHQCYFLTPDNDGAD